MSSEIDEGCGEGDDGYDYGQDDGRTDSDLGGLHNNITLGISKNRGHSSWRTLHAGQTAQSDRRPVRMNNPAFVVYMDSSSFTMPGSMREARQV